MTIDDRLEKLEGQLARVRWFNRCLIGCIVLSLGGWFMWNTFDPETAWAQSGAKEIRATKFVVEDESGKTRGSLGMTKDGPALWLSDENGKTRAALSAVKNGPQLWLFDEYGKLTLGVGKSGPGLWLFDENGKPIWSAP